MVAPEQGEFDAGLQHRALPDPRRDHQLRLMSRQDIGPDDHLAAGAVGVELEHAQRPAG